MIYTLRIVWNSIYYSFKKVISWNIKGNDSQRYSSIYWRKIWIQNAYGIYYRSEKNLGLPMYDAPNAVEGLKRPRSHLTDEMVEAIKDALKHFEII